MIVTWLTCEGRLRGVHPFPGVHMTTPFWERPACPGCGLNVAPHSAFASRLSSPLASRGFRGGSSGGSRS